MENNILSNGNVFLHSVALIVALISGYTDIRYRKILNLVSLPAIAVGFILQVVFFGLPGLISAGVGFLIGFGFFFLFYVFGGMGAGDVKLMGALGALLGQTYIVYTIIFTGLFGLIIVIILFFPYLFLAIKTRKPGIFLAFRKHYMPYGIAISLGAILTILLYWMDVLPVLW
jgi:prepilin peptidase CpaA